MELRGLLRALPQKQVPAKLASQLQVMASHERLRRSASRLAWLDAVDRASSSTT